MKFSQLHWLHSVENKFITAGKALTLRFGCPFHHYHIQCMVKSIMWITTPTQPSRQKENMFASIHSREAEVRVRKSLYVYLKSAVTILFHNRLVQNTAKYDWNKPNFHVHRKAIPWQKKITVDVRPWKWRQYVPSKHWSLPTNSHNVITRRPTPTSSFSLGPQISS
jgi:hypothetical protein